MYFQRQSKVNSVSGNYIENNDITLKFIHNHGSVFYVNRLLESIANQ